MNIATDFDAESIARSVAAEARARDIVRSGRRALAGWHYPLLIAVGAALGWSLSAGAGPATHLLSCMVAGVGFFLGSAAFIECIALRRRLDAALVLLSKST